MKRARMISSTSTSTKPPQQSAFRVIVSSMAGRVAIIGINLATGILTARALQPTGRGEQAAIMLWPVLLANAMTLGLPSAVTYLTRKHRDRMPQLAGASLLLALIVGIVSAFLVSWFMPFLLERYPAPVVFYARCLLLTVPVGIVALVARTILESEGLFSLSIKAQWISPTITLVALVGLWISGFLTPLTSASAYVLNAFPIAVWLLYRLRKTIPIVFSRLLENTRLLLSYGSRSYGIDLCSTLASYVDQALIVTFLAPREMGIYVVALSASRMLNFSQASVVMVLLPKTSALPPLDVLRLTGRAARFSLLATGICALICAFLGPLAIKLLYGGDFSEAVPVFRMLLAEVTIAGTVMVLAQAPMALGRPGVTTVLQSLGLVLTIPLALLLVPKYGILGAGFALLTSTTIRFLFMLGAFPLLLKLDVPRLWLSLAELKEIVRAIRSRIQPSYETKLMGEMQ